MLLEDLEAVLYASAELLRIVAVCVWPAMPGAASRLWEQLGVPERVEDQRLPEAAAWGLLLYLGVVPTAAAYILYVFGLRGTPVTVSGILTLMEPLTASVLGVVFFGDRLGVTGGVGAILLLGAVFLLTLRKKGVP